jgi:ketosteroid isomerase-like protein
MMRKSLCFIAILLICPVVAIAQNPAPAGAAAAGVTSTSSGEVQQFQNIEDTWDNAVNTRDQFSLELVLSPLYVGIAASGDITTRNQEIADAISNQDKTLHLEQKVITVRVLGDIAVANGTYALHHKGGSNQVDERGVFTHVFERQHNKWQCVNSQRTLVRAEEPGKGKKKQSKPGEEPFHIPLFSKGDKDKQ